MTLTVEQYDGALGELRQIHFLILNVHPGIRRHFEAAVELLNDSLGGSPLEVDNQRIRNELLIVRELMGDEYESLPAPDKLIRHVDSALAAIPGDGEPSQAPYK